MGAITPENPHLANTIGNIIFDYVFELVGEDKTPKITGMLIELPVE